MQCLRYVLPAGVVIMGADESALRLCVWDNEKGEKIFERQTQGRVEWCDKEENVFLKKAIEALDDLVQGRPLSTDFPKVASGTDFQKKVWKKLMDINSGETVSYSHIAAELGSGARAVGSAVGANPICIFVPCHRVVAANGGLGGYAGGPDTKKWLLEREIILAM